mmetsp:Transcript_3382/g.6861  ORF Transcript_3382/g.6861 Transcript_3382/m.6861 type:complete len:477 (-) Transcript_3382:30-1460(-)
MSAFLFLSLIFLALLNCSTTYAKTKEDLINAGVEAMETGDFHLAVKHLKAATDMIEEIDAVDVFVFVNLGTALGEIGQKTLSVAQYRKALDIQPENVDAHYFLGLTLQDMGRMREAADAYAAAASRDRMHWESMSNLGAVLLDLSDYSGSTAAFSEAIDILEQREVEPTNAPYDPLPILSQLHYRRGMALSSGSNGKNREGVCVVQGEEGGGSGRKDVDCGEMAKYSFNAAVRYDENNEAAKHMLAALTADATMSRASNTYVKGLFDEYAGNFEESLVKDLGYHGFSLLRKFVGEVLGEKLDFNLVVDAGCGTGLVGNEFRSVSRTLVGMDLSQRIIDEAKIKRPGLYDRTFVGDIVDGVRKEKGKIDLVVAADSFIYFGDLSVLFGSIREGLNVGGYLAFTLEDVGKEDASILDMERPDWRWKLTPSGRFAHRKAYVEDALKEAGLTLVKHQYMENFRFENGVGVMGHMVIAMRK